MKLRNIYLAFKDQMPIKRFVNNFIISGRGWGLFHKNSHISFSSGKPKVSYNRKVTAEKAAKSMQKKRDAYFSNYKCVYCDGYHIGKNRDNKTKENSL